MPFRHDGYTAKRSTGKIEEMKSYPVKSYPVTDPTKLERMLFDAGLVREVSLAEIYDIKARTSIQRTWQNPAVCCRRLDIRNPSDWNDKLHACMRGEFFAYVLKDSRRVLDLGCGEGWPTLYLARVLPEVTGLELSPEHVALARRSAEIMGLRSVRFDVGRIEKLPYEDEAFDGVCFGGNVFTYTSDPHEMLAEIARVLKYGGAFAFEQWPVDPSAGPSESIQWFIDGGPPIVHYGAASGLKNRSYFLFIKPDSPQGMRLTDLAGRMAGELSGEQREACEEIKTDIEAGFLDLVQKAIYPGECRALAAHEFPDALAKAGFEDVKSWALPNAVAFARVLRDAGISDDLRTDDIHTFLSALVAAAPRSEGWRHQWVTCEKKKEGVEQWHAADRAERGG